MKNQEIETLLADVRGRASEIRQLAKELNSEARLSGMMFTSTVREKTGRILELMGEEQ